MPTRAGIPVNQIDCPVWPIGTDPGAPDYIGVSHPYNWMDVDHDEQRGIMQSAVTRGQPSAFSSWMKRMFRGPNTVAQGAPVWLTSQPYSRGAAAHAPHFGLLMSNPIGAGVYAPYRLPTIAGPGARYMYAAIWFDVQAIPTSIRMGRTIPIQTMNALIATSHVGESYLTTG